jgi:hypothetical protein
MQNQLMQQVTNYTAQVQAQMEREINTAFYHQGVCPNDTPGAALAGAVILEPEVYIARTTTCPQCGWTRNVYYRRESVN